MTQRRTNVRFWTIFTVALFALGAFVAPASV